MDTYVPGRGHRMRSSGRRRGGYLAVLQWWVVVVVWATTAAGEINRFEEVFLKNLPPSADACQAWSSYVTADIDLDTR